jgi:hypothetical protein
VSDDLLGDFKNLSYLFEMLVEEISIIIGSLESSHLPGLLEGKDLLLDLLVGQHLLYIKEIISL